MGEADISSGSSVSRAGLILTGGGARAAYQVGVLKALAEIHTSRRLAVPHHRRHLGWRRVGQHPGRKRHPLASVDSRNREGLGQFPRRPGIPLRRAGHAQGRRALDGFAVHGRHDRAAEIAARQLTAARAAFQGDGFRRGARQRGERPPAGARTLRHQLFHRALGVVLRGGDHHQRMVARAAARRARAAVARLPDGQPRHSIPVSADVPARRISSATAPCARPRR